jgi:MarR family transcriptional regulator, lower aerobic nicotinate degradation pathway regulator
MRNRPTWLISRAYARSSSTLNEAFESGGKGLRSYHYRLLSTLDEFGPTGQAELGRIAGIDRSDVVAILNELEEQDLVTRTTDPRNRRRNIVTITAAGTRRLAELELIVSDAQETLMAPLSPTQRAQFVKLLGMIIAE